MSQRAGRVEVRAFRAPCDGRPPVRVPGISLPARAAEVSHNRLRQVGLAAFARPPVAVSPAPITWHPESGSRGVFSFAIQAPGDRPRATRWPEAGATANPAQGLVSSSQVRQDGGRLLPRARCGSAARPDFLQHERSCVWSDAICCDVNNCDSHETFALDGCWIADRNCNSSRGEVNGRGLDRAQGSALLASRQPQNGHAKYRHYLSVIQCVCWCPSIFGVGEDECETKVVSRIE